MNKGWVVLIAVGAVVVLAGIIGFTLKGKKIALYSDDVKYA